jgi:outer membrane usher protein FimD/PapC
MDPSLITTPTARFTGSTPVSGEVEVYVDGIRVYSAPVKPGSFELDNITRYAGLRHVEVLVRDPSGQVIQRSSSTTYLSDRLLRGGLDEFTYAVGLVRPEIGVGSDRYDGLGFAAAHRVGLTDAFTLGAHADRTPDYATAGADGMCARHVVVNGAKSAAAVLKQAMSPAAQAAVFVLGDWLELDATTGACGRLPADDHVVAQFHL